MTPLHLIRLLLAAALLAAATIAQAQGLFRAYLASDGNDASPCTLQQPCRLLPAALNAVASGGEIWMLDSANYNTASVNVTKSVTILAIPGALGSVLAVGGPALNIATAGVKVALRNLVIVPLPGGGGTNGISMTAGDRLDIENCLVGNHAQIGIDVNGAVQVRIADTTVRDNSLYGVFLRNGVLATLTRVQVNGSNPGTGVLAEGSTAGTTTKVAIADSTFGGNGNGAYAGSTNVTAQVALSVRDSRVVNNTNLGLTAYSGAGAVVTLSAANNLVTGNGYGIRAFSAGARVWAAGNTVTDNDYGLFNSAASVFESAGDNAVRNNGANTAGTITLVAPL